MRIWQNLALKIKRDGSQADAVGELQLTFDAAKEVERKKKFCYPMEKWWLKGDDAYGLQRLGCCSVFWDVLE